MFLPPPDLTALETCRWLPEMQKHVLPGTRSFSTHRARGPGGFTLPELLVSMMIFFTAQCCDWITFAGSPYGLDFQRIDGKGTT